MDLAELLLRMDAANKLLATADEVAGGLVALQARGWLRRGPGSVGIRAEFGDPLRETWAREGFWAAWREAEERLAR